MTNYQKVVEFQKKIGGKSFNPSRKSLEEYDVFHQYLLIKEEDEELRKAMQDKNIVEVVDACIDKLYVIYGLLYRLSLDADKLFDIVHKSNMTKGGKLDKNGKLIKGKDYVPPTSGIINYIMKVQKELLGKKANYNNSNGYLSSHTNYQ